MICTKLVPREVIKTLPLVSKKLLKFTQTETQLWRVVNFSLEHTAQQKTWAQSRAQLQAFVRCAKGLNIAPAAHFSSTTHFWVLSVLTHIHR